MSLTPELGLNGWLLESVSKERVSLLSSRAVLPAVLLLGLLWLFFGACACGFVVASASLVSRLETLASSCARWLFSLASVSSDGLGDAAAIDEGGGGVSS
jgi:hypothetical protein